MTLPRRRGPSSPRLLLSSAILAGGLALAGCGGGSAPAPEGGPRDATDAPDAKGTSDTIDGSAARDAIDGGDAATESQATFSCADAGGGACNDNPVVSALWGVCGGEGLCHCNAGFALNPATGRCRPGAGGDAGADAADGAGAPLPPWRSGTRLRARVLKVTDAADAIFQSVFDKDLVASCGFVMASDGATRCMPFAAVPFYADAACKTPVLPMSTGCAPPTHVSRTESCRSSGFKVGAKITPAKIFALSPGATCVEVLGDTRDFYVLTPVVVTGFVAATELRDNRGDSLQMRYWKSEDGGLFPNGAWDKTRDASCVAGTDDYADHCVPAVIAPVSRGVPAFSDDMCKKAVGYTSTTCAAEPVTAVGMFAPSTCGQSMVYAEATKLTSTPYRSFQTTCLPWAMPPADYAFYTPGDSIPIGSLPDLPTVLEGAGRLRIRRYETNAALRIDINTGFYDAIVRGTCLPEDTTKGLRCMSERAYGVTFYSDDKCTMPVHVEAKTKPDPACAAPRPDVLYVDKGAACGGLPKLDLYAVGAAVTPTKLYRADGTMGCVADAADPTALDVFGTTPATDTTAPALVLVTE